MQRSSFARRIAAAFVLTLTAVVGGTTAPAAAAEGSLVITGVVDGPLSGGVPKAIEVYVQTSVPDLSAFGLEAASNGGPAAGVEFTFPAVSVSAGTYLYVATEVPQFTAFFGFAPDYTSFVASINGDDAILLYEDGVAVDVFGVVGQDGTGQAWEHTDGWAKRTDVNAAPTLAFNPGAWTFSGVDALDGALTNAAATSPFPVGRSIPDTDPDPQPDPGTVLISAVQGSGSVVAIGGVVTVEAIVTADFQGGDQLSGFFLQEEDADSDGNAATSEGIFVFCGSCPVAVTVGDLVRVTGNAGEFFGMSQITARLDTDVTVRSSGNPLPAATTVDLPAAGSTRAAGTFESIEGMIVTFADTMVVSEYFELARYGHLVLNAEDRARQFTDANEPSVAGYATFLDELNRSRIYLDDDNNRQNDPLASDPANDTPYFWPRPGLSTANLVRGGDSIDGLTGVLHWSFAGQTGTDAWRVRPVEEAFAYTFTEGTTRSAAPADVGGTLKVASFNVLNYFTTVNSRGADSVVELDRQRAKIAAAICAMDADIVGLIEIENNGDVAISDLLNGPSGVNAGCGEYEFVDTGVIGTDQIAVAFIYRPDTVTPVGDFAVLDSTVDARFDDDRNRPALAQTFTESATGAAVTVVNNHLKSKGSPCTADGDPDVGDGQANCNLTRTAAAEAMVDWLAGDPTGAGTDNVLIIGDLNSYRNEDPIDAIEAGADDTIGTADDYVDLLDSLVGASAYTYLFDGQLGYLDHALANVTLARQVTGATAWNINADEIPLFDYNDEIRDAMSGSFFEPAFQRESSALPLYEPDAYRSSDHDPVIVGLDLNGAPVCSSAEASVPSLHVPNHRLVLVEIVGVTDPDGDEVSITIDGVMQDEPVDDRGSGSTEPDAFGVGTGAAIVRAERSGHGDGRVYHVAFTATDAAGASCSGTVQVDVSRSRNGTPAVDGGALFDSTVAP